MPNKPMIYLNSLDVFAKVDKDATLTRLRIFMRCAGDSYLLMKTITQELGIQKAQTTQHIVALQNLGLVMTELWESDKRSRVVRLTPKGRRLVRRMVADISEPEGWGDVKKKAKPAKAAVPA